MKRTYTAVVKRDAKWWIGWIEEVPGVNGQGRTRRALMASLRSALREALQMNRAEALETARDAYEEVRIDLGVPRP